MKGLLHKFFNLTQQQIDRWDWVVTLKRTENKIYRNSNEKTIHYIAKHILIVISFSSICFKHLNSKPSNKNYCLYHNCNEVNYDNSPIVSRTWINRQQKSMYEYLTWNTGPAEGTQKLRGPVQWTLNSLSVWSKSHLIDSVKIWGAEAPLAPPSSAGPEIFTCEMDCFRLLYISQKSQRLKWQEHSWLISLT